MAKKRLSRKERNLLVSFFVRSARAAAIGLISDGGDLGLVSAHMRAMLQDDDRKTFFDDAESGQCFNDELSEFLQGGKHAQQWQEITQGTFISINRMRSVLIHSDL